MILLMELETLIMYLHLNIIWYLPSAAIFTLEIVLQLKYQIDDTLRHLNGNCLSLHI